jgi:hypothetical protein
MANCPFNTSYPVTCLNGVVGGSVEFYVRSYSAATTYTYASDDTITGSTPTATASTYYRIAQRAGQLEFIPGEAQIADNGQVTYKATLNASFNKYQASLRTLLYSFATTDMEVIVKSNTGQYFLMGEKQPVRLIANASTLGKVVADPNKSDVTLVSDEYAPVREISSTYFSLLNIVG